MRNPREEGRGMPRPEQPNNARPIETLPPRGTVYIPEPELIARRKVDRFLLTILQTPQLQTALEEGSDKNSDEMKFISQASSFNGQESDILTTLLIGGIGKEQDEKRRKTLLGILDFVAYDRVDPDILLQTYFSMASETIQQKKVKLSTSHIPDLVEAGKVLARHMKKKAHQEKLYEFWDEKREQFPLLQTQLDSFKKTLYLNYEEQQIFSLVRQNFPPRKIAKRLNISSGKAYYTFKKLREMPELAAEVPDYQKRKGEPHTARKNNFTPTELPDIPLSEYVKTLPAFDNLTSIQKAILLGRLNRKSYRQIAIELNLPIKAISYELGTLRRAPEIAPYVPSHQSFLTPLEGHVLRTALESEFPNLDFSKLSPQDIHALTLRKNGFTHKKIAEELQIGPASVSQKLLRLRENYPELAELLDVEIQREPRTTKKKK